MLTVSLPFWLFHLAEPSHSIPTNERMTAHGGNAPLNLSKRAVADLVCGTRSDRIVGGGGGGLKQVCLSSTYAFGEGNPAHAIVIHLFYLRSRKKGLLV